MMEDPNERRYVEEEYVEDSEGVDSTFVERRSRVEPSAAERQLDALIRAKQAVWFVTGLLVSLIALRFVLLAVGANLTVGFGALLYRLTQPFVAPFLPLFNEQQAQIQFGSLVAIATYLLIAWAITRLLDILLTPAP